MQPDHLEKATLWKVLNVEKITKIQLTESYAMYPASSVSGIYIGHPESKYFGLDEICEDQIESYSKRKGLEKEVMEKWLGPNLSYKF